MALFGFIVDEIFTLADIVQDEGSHSGNLLEILNQKGDLYYRVISNVRAY